ncbi:MAG: diphthine synthase [Nanoarchaeota archaeon]|nr:diphthine synthase [Nanoarchaeota archaeon]
MALYLIGIGLDNEKDISVRGLEAVKKAHKVYLDLYTSRLHVNTATLEQYYGKKIIEADRTILENNMDQLLEEARTQNIALLVIGSPMAATTHFNYLLEGRKKKILVYVIENASVFSAIGITGLFLYKFGMTISIPKDNQQLMTPYNNFLKNHQSGLHTLFLLDLGEQLMTARQGLDYLLTKGLPPETITIGCGALGSEHPEIIVGTAKNLTLKRFPQCFIIPGTLHFIEEEALTFWKAYGNH